MKRLRREMGTFLFIFCVPYAICYLVGVAQLVYDIVRKKSERQNAVNV